MYTLTTSPSTLKLIQGNIGKSIKFLNLEIFLYTNYLSLFMVKPYDKPNNRHIYTQPDTFYPWHYIYGWLQGENIRLIRSSTLRTDWLVAREQFVNFLKRRDYDINIVKEILVKNDHDNREELLESKEREDDVNTYLTVPNAPVWPMIIKLFKEVKTDWSMVTKEYNFEKIIPVVTKGTSILVTLNKARCKVISDTSR